MTWRRRLRAVVAAGCGAMALVGVSGHAFDSRAATAPPAPAQQVRAGRALYLDGCSSCHGDDARGIRDRGPSLRGVGEVSADFYLRTHRMPLEDPHDEPVRRSQSFYSEGQIAALVAYVGSFGGPRIPAVDPARGDVAHGRELFADHCAGCHQILARGGIVPGAFVPDLQDSRPLDVAEAVDVGPYVMPKFTTLSPRDVDDLARYVQAIRQPDDRGGWGIGHIGPVPEGMVTFLLGMVALLLGIRIIGERTTS